MDAAVTNASNALRDSIARMRDGPLPPAAPYFVQWGTTGRHYLREWVSDLEVTLDAASSSLAAAETAGLSTDGARGLEFALWRIDSGADKLVTILALTLGTPVLRLNHARDGVEFRPNPRQVLNRLTDLANTHPDATELIAGLEGGLIQCRPCYSSWTDGIGIGVGRLGCSPISPAGCRCNWDSCFDLRAS